MGDLNPWFVREALLALYESPDGQTLAGGQVFWAGMARGLSLTKENEGVLLAASGDAYRTEHQVDENHVISVKKTWLVRRQDGAEFTAAQGQLYVLQILWQSDKGGSFYQRTYYGVTCQSLSTTGGVLEMDEEARFRAQNMVGQGGLGRGQVYSPLPAGPSTAIVPFVKEELLVAGEYLLGSWIWAVPVTLTMARASAWASQNTATVLGLEVNGALTGDQIVLPIGAANTEVDVNVAMGVTVQPNQVVRWKILSGPADAASMAWQCSAMVQISY